jgi:hypothetical protein
MFGTKKIILIADYSPEQLEARLGILFQKNDTSIKSISLIGISMPEYQSYLESNFLPTMTWDNYGEEWEIDRIIPFVNST